MLTANDDGNKECELHFDGKRVDDDATMAKYHRGEKIIAFQGVILPEEYELPTPLGQEQRGCTTELSPILSNHP